MSVPDEDLARTTQLLQKYFDSDAQKRFQLERYVGGGWNALAWKLKYTPRSSSVVKNIVVKMERFIAFFDEDAPDQDGGDPMEMDDADKIDDEDKMNDADPFSEEANMWNDPIKNEARWLKVCQKGRVAS